MEDLLMSAELVLAVFFAIVIWVSYHKHFFVIYFDMVHSIFVELLVSFILGTLMAALTATFWPIVALAIGIFAFLNVKKSTDERKKKIIIVMSVISCVLVAIIGIGTWVLC